MDPDGRYVCVGSETNCAKVDSYVSKLKEALGSMRPGTVSHANLTRALDAIGEKDQKGFTIVAAELKSGIANNPQRNVITLDIGKIEKSAKDLSSTNSRLRSASLSVAFGASVLAHEAGHNIDRSLPGVNSGWFPWTREVRRQTEINAYRLQSDVSRALGLESDVYRSGMSESDRRAAISEGAERSVNSACTSTGAGALGC